MRQLGMELQRLRNLAGKSQEEAGAWINKTDTTISKYETGSRRIDVGVPASSTERGTPRAPNATTATGSPGADDHHDLDRERRAAVHRYQRACHRLGSSPGSRAIGWSTRKASSPGSRPPLPEQSHRLPTVIA
ncbi:MAG: helix-turn-helix domain-containing protein [Pseudonocardiaceae bacterium]